MKKIPLLCFLCLISLFACQKPFAKNEISETASSINTIVAEKTSETIQDTAESSFDLEEKTAKDIKSFEFEAFSSDIQSNIPFVEEIKEVSDKATHQKLLAMRFPLQTFEDKNGENRQVAVINGYGQAVIPPFRCYSIYYHSGGLFEVSSPLVEYYYDYYIDINGNFQIKVNVDNYRLYHIWNTPFFSICSLKNDGKERIYEGENLLLSVPANAEFNCSDDKSQLYVMHSNNVYCYDIKKLRQGEEEKALIKTIERLKAEYACDDFLISFDDKTKRYGLYDLDGKQIVPEIYYLIDTSCYDDEGLIIVKSTPFYDTPTEDGSYAGDYGVINAKGEVILKPKYDYIYTIKNQYVLISNGDPVDDGTLQIINLKGSKMIPQKHAKNMHALYPESDYGAPFDYSNYATAWPLKETETEKDLIYIIKYDGTTYTSDQLFTEYLPARPYLFPVNENIFHVEYRNNSNISLEGLYNMEKKEWIVKSDNTDGYQFIYSYDFFSQRISQIRLKDNHYDYYNRYGNRIFSGATSTISQDMITEDYLLIEKDRKWYVMDMDGNLLHSFDTLMTDYEIDLSFVIPY